MYDLLAIRYRKARQLCRLLPLFLVTIGREPVVEAVKAGAGAETDCGPDCHGQCFAGKCLFEGEGLDLEAGSLPAPMVSEQPLAAPPVAKEASVGLHAVGSGLQQLPPPRFPPGGLHSSEFVPGSSGRTSLLMRLPQEAFFGGASAGEAILRRRFGAPPGNRRGLWEPWPLNVPLPREDLARSRLVQVRSGVGPQGSAGPHAQTGDAGPEAKPQPPLPQQGVGPVAFAAAVPHQDAAPPDGMQEYMEAQLEHEQGMEAQLRTENEKLRAELTRWRSAGSKVAAREAQVVELIRRSVGGPMPSSSLAHVESGPQDESSLLEESVETYVFNAGKMPLEDGSNTLRLLLLFFGANASAFVLWLVAGQLEGGCAMSLMEPVLLRAGLGHCLVEVSEIQVRNLPVSGDAYVSLQMGTEKELRTQSVEASEGGVLRFDEIFTLKVSGSDGAGSLVCWVVDRDPLAEERAARLELPARELLRSARRRYGEYFDFDLEPQARRHRPKEASAAFAAPKGRRPCLALRVRDVTGPKGAPTFKGGRLTVARVPPQTRSRTAGLQVSGPAVAGAGMC